MKIKVNDYVRTKAFGINKVKYFEGEEPILENGFTALQSDGYKSSPNIIDLIEENDVIKFWYEKEKICYVYKVNDKLCVWDGFQDRPIEGIYIISVLTKEMFEQMEYKIN